MKRFSLTALLITVFSLTAFGQTKERALKVIDMGVTPYEITELKLGGKVVKSEEKVKLGSDWFSGFSITLKNKSRRTITYIQIGFMFPELTPPLSDSYSLGNYIENGMVVGNKVSLRLLPGESVTFTMPERMALSTDKILRDRRGITIDYLTEVHLDMHDVRFEDGATWWFGEIRVPDLSAPRGWRVVDN